MGNCRWAEKVQAYFDQEPQRAAGVEAHLEKCPECAGLLRGLQGLRMAAQAVPRTRGIEDGQFGAFMAGIREGIEAPARRWSAWWAGLSVVGAATVVALALYSIIAEPGVVVKATEVKSTSTQIENATVDFETIDGVTTIELTVPHPARKADGTEAHPSAYEEDIK